jgi:hypothetical protein
MMNQLFFLFFKIIIILFLLILYLYYLPNYHRSECLENEEEKCLFCYNSQNCVEFSNISMVCVGKKFSNRSIFKILHYFVL